MRISFLAIAVLVAISSNSARAQALGMTAEVPAEQLARARDLIALMNFERQFDFSMRMMRPVLSTSILGQLPADVLTDLDASYSGGRQGFSEDFANRFTERFRHYYPEMIADTVEYYASQFSLAELDTALEFYRSEAGQKFIELLPATQQHMLQLGQRYGRQAGAEAAQQLLVESAALGSGAATPVDSEDDAGMERE